MSMAKNGREKRNMEAAEKDKDPHIIDKLIMTCESAELLIYGRDFLCRTLAILYCYGGGPGSEHFRAPVGHTVAMKAGVMLEEAVLQKDWDIVKKFQDYVRDLQTDNAPWLERTLDKLNIPTREIRLSECVGLTADVPCRLPGRMPCNGSCRMQCKEKQQ